jgi:DNA-binding XRE family transcriptional regulator
MVASQQSLPSPNVRELRQELHLSRERMGRLLDVSSKTVERWEASNRLPLSDRQRHDLALLQEIVTLGGTVYTPEGFTQFLRVPLPAFGGNTALQMMERGRMDAVLGALAADYEGAGF